jgi:transposase-like protein
MLEEIPKTLLDAVRYFEVPAHCNDFMREIKWPSSVIVCPKCGNESCKEIASRPGTIKCNKASCQKQFSMKVGTIFEDSPLGLDKWFVAVWSIANCRNGISSHELGRAIGVTQKTAWFMLHRIRLAMESDTFQKLNGEVESDETYVGGKAKNMHSKRRKQAIDGRGAVGKKPVQAIIQRDGDVGTFVVGGTDAETLKGNILRNVERDSFLYTDTSTACEGLGSAYNYATVNHSSGEFVRGRVSINMTENFFSLLKRALKGTYIQVKPWHLFRYCHEQGFRFNVRTLSEAARFMNLLKGVIGKRITYKQLAAIGDAGFMGIQ